MKPSLRLALALCGTAGFLQACELRPKSPKAASQPAHQTEPDPAKPEGSPQVIQGWLDDYSSHIENHVQENYPQLLELPAWRMKLLCPNWDALSQDERLGFWSALLWSIAGPESNRNRTLVYLENTMSKDSVTGYQVRSEGLLQLSYQDVPNYRYPGGDISWEADRAMAIEDYNAKRKYGNERRTLLSAYANLNLGLWIIKRRLLELDPNLSLEDSLGKYWYVMRPRNDPLKKVTANMESRMPACFR